MSQIVTTCLGIAAPYYNMVLVTILVILFVYLLRLPNKKKVYVEPWKYLFYALCLFIIEEIMTILKAIGLIDYPHIILPVFEFVMISLFIYMCLLQRDQAWQD